MNEVVTGINDKKYPDLILDLLTYKDKISEIVGKIDQSMDRLSSHYQGEAANDLIGYYQSVRANLNTIKNSIKNISDDLTQLNLKVKENSDYIVNMFGSYELEIRQKTKLLENEQSK